MSPPEGLSSIYNVLNSTSTAFMGEVLREALRTSREVHICVSFLRFSGLNLFLDDIRRFLERGGTLRVVVSTYLNVSQPEAIGSLVRLVGEENVRLQDGPDGFHAKFYLFRQDARTASCWVGSSNFTKSGLFTSLEWNTRHDDMARVRECEVLFGEIWERPDVLPATPAALQDYAARYRAQHRNSVPPQPQEQTAQGPVPNAAQREALRELSRLRSEGQTKAAVVAATGIGKTYLAAFDARALERASGGRSIRVLFVAHREELLQQARTTYRQVLPGKTSGILAQGQHPGNVDMVFGTVQSLTRPEHSALLEQPYDYVVIDEFHHASADSYRRLLDTVRYRFLLGLTATPERVDGQDVLRLCDYNVAYEVRLPEAIDRGWLIPFHYFGIADEVDYEHVPWRHGQFDVTALENALMLNERTDLILRHALEKGYDGRRRATVGFCAGVRHAEFMAATFCERGRTAVAVTGRTGSAERRVVYQQFSDPNHPLEWLFVADVLNEGIDIPAINSLLFLRPTESPGLFLQQLGRGLRLHPDTEVLTILDFVGHHKNALLPLRALNSAALNVTEGRVLQQKLELNPPKHCAIVLEDKTQQMLLKLQQQTAGGWSKKALVKEAYQRLRAELSSPDRPELRRRPEIMDFWGRADLPDFGEVRRAFGSWLECRLQMGDADEWELAVQDDSLVARLLRAAESDLQAQRVYPYAVLWALSLYPEDVECGVRAFLERYPQWRLEGDIDVDAALRTLEKKPQFKDLLENGRWSAGLERRLKKDPRLSREIERRIEYTLASDYRVRHGGVLRTPADLVRYQGYRRSEIVNYFGVQFDPAKHNVGVLKFDGHFALLTQIDTSDARESHQYQNGFAPDWNLFNWQSQNRQSPLHGTGREIVEHGQTGTLVHLFVQGAKHSLYYYLGAVSIASVEGSEPFNALFQLPERLPEPLHYHFTK